MATLHDFFVAEVSEHLGQFEDALEAGDSADLDALHRAARALRGTAQIAREDAAFRGANVLESATRALLDGRLQPDAATVDRLRASAEDLRAIARGADDTARADAIVARWAEIGIDPRSRTRPGTVAQETRAFLEFAAREVVAIAEELDRSVHALTDSPMDRDSLKAVLRRQRALLGSARLEEIPVLSETLRAVEDLSSIIAKLDVAVRHEWLDVFRCAREVLKSAAPQLQTGRQPEPTTALRRLRVLRQELVERHGAGEAVSTAPGTQGLAQPETRSHGDTEHPAELADRGHDGADESERPEDPSHVHSPAPLAAAGLASTSDDARPQAAPVSSTSESERTPTPVVPNEGIDVRELQYRGDRALERAAELRPVLERMLQGKQGGREALAELYDLLRLARE